MISTRKIQRGNKMNKIRFVISLIFIIVFFIVLNGYVIAQPTQEQELTKAQLEAFRSAKTVRIEIDQNYGVADISLPFEEIAKTLIKHAGLQVVSPDANDYDLKLSLVIRGQGLSRYYANVQMSLYTGASLSGSIALRMQGKPIYKRTFKRVKEPPTMFLAMRSLDQYKTPSYGPFSVLLSVPSPIVLTIMEVIGEIYGSNIFIKALREKNGDIRNNARVALEHIGPPSVKVLIPVLKEKNWETRWQAAMALGNIKDLSAVEPLLSVLNDEHHSVRWMAVDALGKIMDYRAVEPMIATLNDENPEVKKKAIWALKKITEEDFGEDQEKWHKWWEENKEKFIKDN